MYFLSPQSLVLFSSVRTVKHHFGWSLQPGIQFKLLRTFFGEKLAGPITFVSWLRYIFPFSMIYSNIIKAMDSFRILLKHVIEDQR